MKVKIIQRQGDAVLVEYLENGEPQRVTVPADVLKGTQVSKENLAKGIPRGNLDGLTLEFPTAEEFIKRLNDQGIWTRCEILNNMSTVRGVLNEYVKINQAKLRAFAKE